jgi:hypothetical protein
MLLSDPQTAHCFFILIEMDLSGKTKNQRAVPTLQTKRHA